MNLLTLFIIALGLSADCFAVAASAGLVSGRAARFRVFRTAFAFGIAQFLMPVIGWLAGTRVVDLIAAYDHWVAFGLLALAGGLMIREYFHPEHETIDLSRWPRLLFLALATSIDSLAAGLSFAFLRINILSASSLIGAVAFLVTLTGFYAGRRGGEIIDNRARLIGGLILIGIGIRILLSHLFGG